MKNVIISCYNDGQFLANSLQSPVGFSWISDLLKLDQKKEQELIALLHGGCLKYGLRNKIYKKHFGTNNPFKKLLKSWTEQNVTIKICQLCLTKDGFTLADLLKFVEPVPFSIQYLIVEQEQENAIVIYDS